MMSLTIHEAGPDEIEALIPILRQAEETESALRWSLANLSDAVYRMDSDGKLVGAATMQWREEGSIRKGARKAGDQLPSWLAPHHWPQRRCVIDHIWREQRIKQTNIASSNDLTDCRVPT